MRFVVERIEESIASLENLETGEIMNFDVSKIPFEIYEGDCLIFEDQSWKKDEETKKKINDRINKKMMDLWE